MNTKHSATKIREVTRTSASPKPGMGQQWTEFQVMKGRTVLSRHDRMADAITAMERLTKTS